MKYSIKRNTPDRNPNGVLTYKGTVTYKGRSADVFGHSHHAVYVTLRMLAQNLLDLYKYAGHGDDVRNMFLGER